MVLVPKSLLASLELARAFWVCLVLFGFCFFFFLVVVCFGVFVGLFVSPVMKLNPGFHAYWANTLSPNSTLVPEVYI